MQNNYVEVLSEGAISLGIKLTEDEKRKLIQYLDLIKKWGRVYNLTAIQDPLKIVTYHLLDCLAVSPYVKQGKWLDVGSGAGLPGIVLAIVKPESKFVLLDTSEKKASFMQQVVIELELKNVLVLSERIETLSRDEKFDGIISRAFSEIAKFTQLTKGLLTTGGEWVAMKGNPEEEIRKLPEDIFISEVIPLKIPKLDAARCVVIMKEKNDKNNGDN